MRDAAIVTIGSEITEGLRIDTHTAEIARALTPIGFRVARAVSVGDDVDVLADELRRLVATSQLVVVTGGLGPTHDDVTREATSRALGLPLIKDETIAEGLKAMGFVHKDPKAAEQALVQAEVLQGAQVIPATTGTAPGQIVEHEGCVVALLPGPPAEMRPMLAVVVSRYPTGRALPVELGVNGLSESDAQLTASRALEGYEGVTLTVLASPGDVRIILIDDGAGDATLATAAQDVCSAFGDRCYTKTGERLQQALVSAALGRKTTFATAESCTGGMIAAAVTDVPGASEVYLGSVVSYSNQAKVSQLGVEPGLLETYGAVSEQVALQMARGARERFATDIALGVTGIAGPDGGTAEKPVGLVWFAVATSDGAFAVRKHFKSRSREAIRLRATSTGLDLLRLEVLKAGS